MGAPAGADAGHREGAWGVQGGGAGGGVKGVWGDGSRCLGDIGSWDVCRE